MTEFKLRTARAGEGAALARISWDARETIPLTNSLHTFDEVVAYHETLIATMDVRVATNDGDTPIGFAARDGGVLAQFYIAPKFHRRGAGRALLSAMRAECALEFWCFAHNARALAFYRSFGAVEIGREVGPENEEGLPAIKLRVERG